MSSQVIEQMSYKTRVHEGDLPKWATDNRPYNGIVINDKAGQIASFNKNGEYCLDTYHDRSKFEQDCRYIDHWCKHHIEGIIPLFWVGNVMPDWFIATRWGRTAA